LKKTIRKILVTPSPNIEKYPEKKSGYSSSLKIIDCDVEWSVYQSLKFGYPTETQEST
jgi:hypothetical protein